MPKNINLNKLEITLKMKNNILKKKAKQQRPKKK